VSEDDGALVASETNVRVTRKRVVAAKRVTSTDGRVATKRETSNDGRVAAKRAASNVGAVDRTNTSSNDGLVAAKRAASNTAAVTASNDGLIAADSLARVAKSMRVSKRSASERADDAATSLERVSSTLRSPRRSAKERADDAATSLERVARKLRAPKRSAKERADDAATSLERVARKLRTPRRSAKERADDVYVVEHEPFDLHVPARAVNIELVGGRAHYDRVIAAVMQAHTSVWIATANVKGMMVEGAAQPGTRRTRTSAPYVSVISRLDELAARGVELRLLHAEIPSGPFREELVAHPRLANGALALARCPRVHMKAVIVDGALLYLGSANWTGAGLGAKGSGKRNFELGVITDDAQLLDQVQALYERVWTGAECARCKLRDVCPGPLDEHVTVEAKRSRRVARLSKRA
jgi:phosphatidylserine/phosphatidylglycerophosphate/cardiolipin synthase-like enzyme